MDLISIVRIVTIALTFILGVGTGVFLIKKLHLSWGPFLFGGATYFGAQIAVVVLISLLRQVVPADTDVDPQVYNLTFFVAWMILQELIRYASYRWWARDVRTWRQALLFGSGHGGIELVLAGATLVTSLVTMTSMRPLAKAEKGLHAYADAESGVTVYYQGSTQMELVSPQGIHVYFDVSQPDLLSIPAVKDDLLLTTHTAAAEKETPVDNDFINSFPGQKLTLQAKELTSGDVVVHGIASSYQVTGTLAAEGSSNYIYVVETGGLRIAHFGIIGQRELTTEQLTALGKIDIAIMQFSNPLSKLDSENRLAWFLMDQVKPRLLIPTLIDLPAAKLAGSTWPLSYADSPSAVISAQSLPAETSLMFVAYGIGGIKAYWEAPWYAVVADFVRTVCFLPVQIACAILVLQVFLRRNFLWLAAAIGWHILSLLAMYVIPSLYLQTLALIAAAAVSALLIWRLREAPAE